MTIRFGRRGLSTEAKARLARHVDKVARAWEPRFRTVAVRQFSIDRDEILAAMGSSSKARGMNVLPEYIQRILEKAGTRWRRAFIPVVSGLIQDQGEALTAAFGLSFDVQNVLALDFLMEYVMPFASNVVDGTADDVAAVIAQGMKEGWTTPVLMEHLQTLFEQYMRGDLAPEQFAWFSERMPGYRAEMISRSETIRASAKGSERIYAEAGIEEKEWLATEGNDRTCIWCSAMNGKRIAIGADWFSKGDSWTVGEGDKVQTLGFNYENVGGPPLHPNCRCTLIPVI